MKVLTPALVVLALAPLLLFSTGACGGSGTVGIGVGINVPLFSGTYCFVSFAGENGAPDEASVSWGELTADGAGMVTGATFMENENGVISMDTLMPTPYTVDDNRRISLLNGGVPFQAGLITADGGCVALSAVAAGEVPGIALLGKKGSGHSNASLNGLWYLAAIIYDAGGPSDTAIWGSVMFDGIGGGMATFTENDDGALLGPGPGMLPYNVTSADGSLTATLFGIDLAGAIVSGGEAIILGGGTTGGSDGALLVLTKGTAGATNALFTGPFALVGLDAETIPPPEWSASLFFGAADGAGMFNLTEGTINADGTATPSPIGPIAYSVGAMGLFDFAGSDYFGGITPSGDLAVCAGQAGGGDPEFFFFLK